MEATTFEKGVRAMTTVFTVNHNVTCLTDEIHIGIFPITKAFVGDLIYGNKLHPHYKFRLSENGGIFMNDLTYLTKYA